MNGQDFFHRESSVEAFLADRCPAEASPGGPVFYAKKVTALVVFGELPGLLVR